VGPIPVIEEIEYINAAVPGTFAANWLALNIEISGDIGELVTLSSSCHANTAVEAHQIARLHCNTVYEDITLLSDSLKSDGIVTDFIIAGDFLGDLYVPGDLIGLEVAGDIGTLSTAACIESDSNIGVIEAENIYAQFDAELNIGTIRAFGTSGPSSSGTDAVFNGSVDCE